MSTTPAAPRSLADDLRLRDDDALTALLAARPDLLHPVPADLGQLAVRAATSPSVTAALETLNRLDLQVCEAVAGLPDPSTPEQVHSGLAQANGYNKSSVDASLQHLRDLGIVWGNELHLVRAAREAFGAYPCGLATSYALSHRAVRDYAENPKTLLTLLESAPTQVRDIVDQLAWTPNGTMKNANRRVTVESAKTPLEWMLAHSIIVATGEATVVMPREVSLIVRDGLLMRELAAHAPSPISGSVPQSTADASGAHQAMDLVRLVELLLEEWSITPPSALRTGGLAVRDVTALSSLLRVDEYITALVCEIAVQAGLAAQGVDGSWLPTTAYDRWLASDDAARWTVLANAWRDLPRTPTAGDGSERVLAPTPERGNSIALRATVLGEIAGHDEGATTDVAAMTAHLAWQRPRRNSAARDHAIECILNEAAYIGILGAGAFTSFGRAVMASQPAEQLLAVHIPEPVDHIIVQADLTALAPGRLLPIPARTMSVIADVESTGVATTYRFTPASIRRGLDQGHSAHDITSFLTGISRTPLPQPLTYLIDDIARGHGVLRVGAASVYLRCDDLVLMTQLIDDKRLATIRLRAIAPGIVISASPADMVLEKLRAAGYSPAPESPDGTLLIHRPDTLRTSPKPVATPVTVSQATPRLVAAAVKALRAGERSVEVASATVGPRTSTSETLALLTEALSSGSEVWMGYADRGGITTERIVEPLSISGGFLTAFDVRTNEVRTFTIARITGAQYAGEDATP